MNNIKKSKKDAKKQKDEEKMEVSENTGATESKTTTDRDTIMEWVDERGGRPALVRATETNGSGLLRIDFAESDDSLDEISWDEFFKIFEENDLAFLYQEKTKDGGVSRFFKFVKR